MYDPENFKLEDQVAVITGAGAGIGRAIAETFGAAGAAVVVNDLNADTANAVAKEIETQGGRAVGITCDVTSEDAERRYRKEDVGTHADPSLGRASGHGQRRPVSVFASGQLDQRPDIDRFGWWRTGVRLTRIRQGGDPETFAKAGYDRPPGWSYGVMRWISNDEWRPKRAGKTTVQVSSESTAG